MRSGQMQWQAVVLIMDSQAPAEAEATVADIQSSRGSRHSALPLLVASDILLHAQKVDLLHHAELL